MFLKCNSVGCPDTFWLSEDAPTQFTLIQLHEKMRAALPETYALPLYFHANMNWVRSLYFFFHASQHELYLANLWIAQAEKMANPEERKGYRTYGGIIEILIKIKKCKSLIHSTKRRWEKRMWSRRGDSACPLWCAACRGLLIEISLLRLPLSLSYYSVQQEQ